MLAGTVLLQVIRMIMRITGRGIKKDSGQSYPRVFFRGLVLAGLSLESIMASSSSASWGIGSTSATSSAFAKGVAAYGTAGK